MSIIGINVLKQYVTNNCYQIKTFLTYYKDDFVILTGKTDAELPIFVKKSIGAFWGMVFKYGLKYKGQKSVSVSMNEYFKVKTATYFIKNEV